MIIFSDGYDKLVSERNKLRKLRKKQAQRDPSFEELPRKAAVKSLQFIKTCYAGSKAKKAKEDHVSVLVFIFIFFILSCGPNKFGCII